MEAERPLTHDLLATMLDELGASVRHIVVSDLADETYRARIVLVQGGDDYEIDARPSDAIALAVRAAAPIFATEAVLDRAGVIPEADEDEKLSVFREFVNSLEADPPEGGSRPSWPLRHAAAGRSWAAARPPTTARSTTGSATSPGARARPFAGCHRQDGLAATRAPRPVGPQAQAQRPEVADRAQDHTRVGTRGPPGRARVVRHALLHDDAAALADLDEQLRREERAARFDAHALERLAPEQLAGAVGVAHAEAEEEAQAWRGRCGRRRGGWRGRRA